MSTFKAQLDSLLRSENFKCVEEWRPEPVPRKLLVGGARRIFGASDVHSLTVNSIYWPWFLKSSCKWSIHGVHTWRKRLIVELLIVQRTSLCGMTPLFLDFFCIYNTYKASQLYLKSQWVELYWLCARLRISKQPADPPAGSIVNCLRARAGYQETSFDETDKTIKANKII